MSKKEPTTEEIKNLVIEKLKTHNVYYHADALMSDLVAEVKKITGSNKAYGVSRENYLKAWVIKTPPPEPRLTKKGEYKPPFHFRDAEINAMPRPILMSGPGLGDNSGYGRGR